VRRFPFSIRRIKVHLKRGGLIAYPTESCYGIGCDPNNRDAVLRLLKLKQRSSRQGLILIASNYHQVTHYLAPVTPAEQAKIINTNSVAITYLMPARNTAPRWLRGAHDTLAVRFTSHPFAKQLCHSMNCTLVSTSANRKGQRATKTQVECRQMFGKNIMLLPGRLGKHKRPSRIIMWEGGNIIRE